MDCFVATLLAMTGKPFWFLGVNSADSVSFCDGDAVAA
jgi:hypothetical protein